MNLTPSVIGLCNRTWPVAAGPPSIPPPNLKTKADNVSATGHRASRMPSPRKPWERDVPRKCSIPATHYIY